MVVFDCVFIFWEYVFMDGEYDFVFFLVERFIIYYWWSYVCKSGVGDVLIGVVVVIVEYNGIIKVLYIKDKLVEMIYLNEMVYGMGIVFFY